MKMDITMAVPGLPFNGKTFDSQSLGGSETAGYYMAKALAKLGHRVQVFCNTQPMSCEDVDYLPLDMFRPFVEYTTHDVCIVQRQPELLAANCRARFTGLWCHDLAMGRHEAAVKGVAWNYDKVFVLSEFMRQQYKDTYHLDDNSLFVTHNGVDLALVEKVKANMAAGVKRNPLSLVYSARPERGLDVLLAEIFPRILQHEPNARLFLSAYDNPVDSMREFYANCNALAARLGDRVVNLGALTKAQLYEVYLNAGVYVYPTPSPQALDFDEVSCISAMEAQACGLPFVTTARGALPETIAPGAGALITAPIGMPAYYDSFVTETLRLMRSPSDWREASRRGEERAATYGWDGVAEQWTAMFESQFKERTANTATMANHFWRHSDIYAAKACLAKLPADDVASKWVRERVETDWAFLNEEDGFRKQYERIGSTHNPDVINWAPREPRYAAMREWLAKMSKEVMKAIDYGCAHGAYATNLMKELPHLSITGVDIDSRGIELGYQFAEALGVKERWRGVVGTFTRLSDASVPEMTEQYDLAIAQEVLEHVEDPAEILKALEARVRDDGFVYATVPFGPWEYSDYRRYPHRAHIWEFDLQDLHDMLDAKGREADVRISAMPYGYSPESGEPMGWWVITYRVTEATRGKVGTINMERKLALQNPRQTLSVAIIAGPNCEETLHWTLRSLEHTADEVVIADCGLSPDAKSIIDSYAWKPLDGEPKHAMNIRVIPGVDPKTQGFETPRNMALAACTQDWVLWIDTDEKMLDVTNLTKYLRPNLYQGYSIRQHHFAVDTTFSPDMPVRLFRNNKKLRFFGMIHEHPESALNCGPGNTIVVADVHIAHVGYLIETGRKQRFNRNYPMLQADIAKYPDRKLQKLFIMRDNMLLASYELSQNGGKITPDIQARAEETIRLYREHFLAKGNMGNTDPIQYYSQAVGLLGEGFDAVIQVSADKFDAKPNGHIKARFASTDDLVTEMTFRAKEAARPFESKYY